MEIHHHPKHSDKPRSYKEYLFEFLVIFIAIVGSFFAENLRDHFVDIHKEREYLEGLLEDVTGDSANLQGVIQTNRNQIKGLDSLLSVINNPKRSFNLKSFYYLDFKYTTNYNDFIANTSMLSLIMRTGGLNLIRNKSISDAIVNYDIAINNAGKQADLLEKRFENIMDQQSGIIDFKAFIKPDQESVLKRIALMHDFPPLSNQNISKLNAFYFNLIAFRGTIIGYNQRLSTLLERNKSLAVVIENR